MITILDCFENAQSANSNKVAFVDGEHQCTYASLSIYAKAIGSSILEIETKKNLPIVIFLPKGIYAIMALLGIAYSGNFYVMMDTEMPKERRDKIFENLKPRMILTETKEMIHFSNAAIPTYDITKWLDRDMNEVALRKRRNEMISTDPLYVLYTSGSTGIPKGVVVSHLNVMSYIEWVIHTFDINNETIFGSQTPFYFSMSVLDIFSTLFTGATFYILQKKMFSFPLRLIEYLNEKQINTIYWVPSALSIVANTKTLDYIKISHLNKILFAGEVMPTKQLNYWRRHLPDATYANLYGPTELTDICAYYIVDREFNDDEALPIGYPCDNCEMLIFDENQRLVGKGEMGELCVRGPFVAMGYYNNEEKTKEVFIQNPKNTTYPEIIYKTGDLVMYGSENELLYMGRKDYQIKHMGYRIELGEIETAVQSMDGMEANVCIYDEQKDKIILIYQGKMEKADVLTYLKGKVPRYMQPSKIFQMSQIPWNANGKIDRKWVKEHYKEIEM